MQGPNLTQPTSHQESWKSSSGLFSSPYKLLVSPTRTWGELSRSASPAHSVLAQFILLAIGRLIAWQPMSDMVQSVSGGAESNNPPLPWALLGELLFLAFSVLVANFAVAGLIYGGFLLLGIKPGFKRMLVWLSYGLLPICLGYLAGTIPLWFVQPLSTDLAAALAWQIKPFSLGVVPLFPDYFSPLSAQWFIASTFDLFGCWALWLLAVGAFRYLKYDFGRSAWITCGLVLLFFIAASGMWQVFQAFLVYRG